MAKSAEIREEIRQFNERHQWPSDEPRGRKQKRLNIVAADASTGFGYLTNALLFGDGLKTDIDE